MKYTCNVCLKEFYDKKDFTRHKNRKWACISQHECESRLANYRQVKIRLNNLQVKYDKLKNANEQDKLNERVIQEAKVYVEQILPKLQKQRSQKLQKQIEKLLKKFGNSINYQTIVEEILVNIDGKIILKVPKYLQTRIHLGNYLLNHDSIEKHNISNVSEVKRLVIAFWFGNNTHIDCPVCSKRKIDTDKAGRQIAHIIPKHLDGPYQFWNLVVSCGCNSEYNNNMLDFMGTNPNKTIRNNLKPLLQKMYAKFHNVLNADNLPLKEWAKILYFPCKIEEYENFFE